MIVKPAAIYICPSQRMSILTFHPYNLLLHENLYAVLLRSPVLAIFMFSMLRSVCTSEKQEIHQFYFAVELKIFCLACYGCYDKN